jgi:hypothetical protein
MRTLPGPSRIGAKKPARGRYSKEYRDGLKKIADGLATAEGSEQVLVRHLDEAFRILAARSHSTKPWFKRHEWEIGLGGTLVGLSFSIPDFIAGFVPDDGALRRAVIPSLMLLLMGFGLFLFVHGFLRGRGFFS